jgi:transposase InsO family protein
MRRGFMYLTAVIDWFSRYVLSWRLSNTLDGRFCPEALDEALAISRPEIFNTGQGPQFTAQGYTGRLEEAGIAGSRDGRGRAPDNVFVERLWRSVICLGQVGEIDHEAGGHADAAVSLRRAVAILEQLPVSNPFDRYNLACTHAALAGMAADRGSGMTAAEGRAEAERAMDWLRQAVAAGYRNLALMRGDPTLDPLRSRDDFRLLMMDLAMPAEPFSKDTDADR